MKERVYFPYFDIFCQVHAYIISHLKKEMPSMFGKDSKKKELINKLGHIYQQIQREYNISAGDFPSLQKMQQQLEVRLQSICCRQCVSLNRPERVDSVR